MAEAVDSTSRLVPLTTFALRGSVTLRETISTLRLTSRPFRGLIEETDALTEVVKSLETAARENPKFQFSVLEVPLKRCAEACLEFAHAIQRFCCIFEAERPSFPDWARLRYMGEDIDGFRRLLSGYRMTIVITVSDESIRKSSITAEAAEDYKELHTASTARLDDRLKTSDAMFDTKATQSKFEPVSHDLVERYCDRASYDDRGYLLLDFKNAGSYGTVSIVKRASNEIFARKQIPRHRLSLDKMKEEVSILRKASHQHIVAFIDDYYDFDCSEAWREFGKTRSLLLSWLFCLSIAVQHLHSLRIRHRDIKPSNILIHGDHIYLTDFGISFYSEEDTVQSKTSTRGTDKYEAKEAKDGSRCGRKADIFSLAAVFVDMIACLSSPVLFAPFPSVTSAYSIVAENADFVRQLRQVEEHPGRRKKLSDHYKFNEAYLCQLMLFVCSMLGSDLDLRPHASIVVTRMSAILQLAGCNALTCCREKHHASGQELNKAGTAKLIQFEARGSGRLEQDVLSNSDGKNSENGRNLRAIAGYTSNNTLKAALPEAQNQPDDKDFNQNFESNPPGMKLESQETKSEFEIRHGPGRIIPFPRQRPREA